MHEKAYIKDSRFNNADYSYCIYSCLLYTSLFVETENGGQLRYLTPGQAPKAVFELGGEKPVAVYAYCNLHGLWMTKL